MGYKTHTNRKKGTRKEKEDTKSESKEEIQVKRENNCGILSSSSEDENFDVQESGTVIPDSSSQPGCSYWRDDRADPVTFIF